MKKRLILLGIIFIIATAVIFFFVTNFKGLIFDKPKDVSLEYGTHFPNLQIYLSNGENSNILFNKTNKKVVFYLSANCSSCVEKLSSIKNIINLSLSTNTKFLIIWEDEIPTSRIEKIGIPNCIQSSLKGKVRINDVIPEYFILNENNDIEFIARGDLNALVDKLWDGNKNLDSTNKVISSIIEDYAKSHNNFDKNKKTILFFGTNDCEACRISENVITSKKNKLNDYNLITISQEKDNKINIDIIDRNSIYSQICNINQFPYFILLNINQESESTFNDIDSLLKYIKI